MIVYSFRRGQLVRSCSRLLSFGNKGGAPQRLDYSRLEINGGQIQVVSTTRPHVMCGAASNIHPTATSLWIRNIPTGLTSLAARSLWPSKPSPPSALRHPVRRYRPGRAEDLALVWSFGCGHMRFRCPQCRRVCNKNCWAPRLNEGKRGNGVRATM